VLPSRIVVLHNAISPDWLNRPEQMDTAATAAAQNVSNNLGGKERVVLAVGRLSREKAFPDLVLAVSELRRLRPDLFVRLLIVGDGPERGRIERVVHQLDLEDRVTLAGHVRDVRPYYRDANVLAISSISEGSPNVLLEAMAAGVPVAATAVGGIPEIVADKKTGLLIEPRNPQAMAAAINLLFSNSDLARTLTRNAEELIRNTYSPENRARFLLKLYQTISPS
jgi:glycosyltransferase involved in cell wall biosynthesis